MIDSQPAAAQNGVAEFDFSYAELGAADFELSMLEGNPVLEMVCAAENPAYSEALLKIGGERRRDLAKKDARRVAETGDTEAMVRRWRDDEQEREDDRAIYPGTVVRGWRNVINSKGEPVPYSIDACRAFFAKLPDWILNRIRWFAVVPKNFSGKAPPPPAATVAGNS